jgi:hypothetical protein
MKRNIKKNIFLSLFLFLVLATASGVVYLDKVYLPVKIKTSLTKGLQEALHYNVDIAKINFNLINGIVIHDIFVYDKIKDKENTILYIKQASFHLLYLPLLKDQKVIIPILHIYSPELKLRYRKGNTLNVSALFSPGQDKSTKQKNKVIPLIYKINILKGELLFEDERQQPKFSKIIQDLNIGLSAGDLKKASFVIRGNILPVEEKPSKISLQGDYNFSSKELAAKLNLVNLNLAELDLYLKSLPFSITSGRVENTNLSLKLKNKNCELSGIVYLKEVEANREKLKLVADLDILPQLSYAIDTKTFTYKLGFRFNAAKLQGIKYLESASAIKGNLELTNDVLRAENLEFEALDSNFKLNGSLENFSNPSLALDLESSNLKLEKAFPLINHPQGLNLSGIAKARVGLKGNLKELPLEVKAELTVEDAKLETPVLKEPLQHIKGGVVLEPDEARWEELVFNYQDTLYTTTGRLIDFKTPSLNFKISSKDLKLASDIKIDLDLINLNTLNAKYIDSDCDIKGTIEMQEKNNPLLDLAITLKLNPKDIMVFLPKQLAESIQGTKLQGNIQLSGSISGKAKNYKDWNIEVEGSSELLSIYNFRFNNLFFNLLQRDKLFNISGLSASSYSGVVNLDFVSNLTPNEPTYALKFSSLGIDLGQLKSDIGLKDKDLAGILNINANLAGDFKDSASLKGNGLLSIKNGKLWQLNLLRGLGELFLLPSYEKIIFKEAMAGFNIENKAISTEDLQLVSDQLKLNCEGSLGFNGSLNFIAYAQVNKEFIRESSDLRKFTAAILGELGSAISIKIGGTTSKPKYHLVPIPLDLLKRVKDFFLSK